MRNLNNVILIGNLTRTLGENPQIKDLVYFQNGTAKAVLSIAVNDVKKDQQGNWVDEVNFFNVTLFGRQVEALKVYLVKGQKIAVSGKLHQNRWTDQNGQNHSTIEIIADNIELCGNHQNNQMNQQQIPQQQQYQQPRQQNFVQNNNQMNQQQIPQQGEMTYMEDIPF